MKLTLTVLSLVAVVALSAPIVEETEPTLHKLLLDNTLPQHLRDGRLIGGDEPAARVKRGCRWCEELGKKVGEKVILKLVDIIMRKKRAVIDGGFVKPSDAVKEVADDGGLFARELTLTKDELEKLAVFTRVADGDDKVLVDEKSFLGGVVNGLVGEIM